MVIGSAALFSIGAGSFEMMAQDATGNVKTAVAAKDSVAFEKLTKDKILNGNWDVLQAGITGGLFTDEEFVTVAETAIEFDGDGATPKEDGAVFALMEKNVPEVNEVIAKSNDMRVLAAVAKKELSLEATLGVAKKAVDYSTQNKKDISNYEVYEALLEKNVPEVNAKLGETNDAKLLQKLVERNITEELAINIAAKAVEMPHGPKMEAENAILAELLKKDMIPVFEVLSNSSDRDILAAIAQKEIPASLSVSLAKKALEPVDDKNAKAANDRLIDALLEKKDVHVIRVLASSPDGSMAKKIEMTMENIKR